MKKARQHFHPFVGGSSLQNAAFLTLHGQEESGFLFLLKMSVLSVMALLLGLGSPLFSSLTRAALFRNDV
jgi:hypothetical protein